MIKRALASRNVEDCVLEMVECARSALTVSGDQVIMRPRKAQQIFHISGNSWEKKILTFKWILNNILRVSPYSLNVSNQEGVRDVQPSKVPESTP